MRHLRLLVSRVSSVFGVYGVYGDDTAQCPTLNETTITTIDSLDPIFLISTKLKLEWLSDPPHRQSTYRTDDEMLRIALDLRWV
jgi:hypothetical protein